MTFLFPKIWDLIDLFKEQCRLSRWETVENEDLVKTEDGEYHGFLWTKTIHPSTFEKIVTNRKCGICRGNYYEVVNISYICWLFPETPPESLILWINGRPKLAQKTAIFDLSCAYIGKGICRKLNETESIVFKEFEHFLEEEWSIEFMSIDKLPALTA